MLKHFLVPEEDKVFVTEEKARAATQAVFEKMGIPAQEAESCSDVLITSDLRGCESHGISNMLRHYIASYGTGTYNPHPDIKVERESSVTATWDGDQGLGLHLGPRAMKLAIEKAREHGMGAVAVKNTAHFGMLAYYVMQAVEQDMVGMAMVSAGGGAQLPTHGAEPAFGTQPIAWGAPAATMPPFIFDVATTQVAANKLGLARRIGSKVEPGWIANLDGSPIMEAVDVPEAGTYNMLPFGGTRENGGHKGYGFAVIADIMSGILSGNGPGFIADRKYSFFVMAFNIDAFVDVDEFKDDMDKLLKKLANTTPAPGHDRVYYAGLPEAEETVERKKTGIPYHKEVVEWYNSMSNELNLGIQL
ncbi:MAG TPA: Ldh family oxidoreductase [Dehalococcoidia bacterium]|jgi:LDH2 family malate/lactate/ureidoglycolate dehydrogenase|nr:Ldh family oxidoreductase [Dehalococcoidia bacterium]HIK89071.1 Ldh family oxidoreductase [Dehalococcoidia bacterium]